jgi:hypothetical protein
MRTRHRWVGPVAIMLSLAGPSCLAQTASSFSDVPDHYRLELGGFRLGSDTTLRLNNGTGGGSDVKFEDGLALPDTSTRFYLEGYWRVGRRHELSLGWFGTHREGPGKSLSRDVVWGDRVFTAGTQAQGKAGADYFSGVYRFAAYRNDRFEIGPAVGIGYLSVDASIRTTPTLTGASGSASTTFEQSASKGQITGDLGAYLAWWPAKRFLLRGDGRYILVKPEKSEASITDARASAIYHPWPKVGAGVQYTYTKFRYDRDILSRELGGSLRYSGIQLLLGFAF